jgi:hypothetical protein
MPEGGGFHCKKMSAPPFIIIKVGSQVLTAASMKMAAFWAAAPRSLIEGNQRFGGSSRRHRQDDDGDNMHLSIVHLLLRNYITQYPRRLSSSYLPPWKLKTSQNQQCLRNKVPPGM